MPIRCKHVATMAAAVIATVVVQGSAALAQMPATVRIAIVNELNGVPGKALIVRAPGECDVILLKASDANSTALGAALEELIRQRTRVPTPLTGTMVALQGYAAYPWRNKGTERALTTVLDRLMRQPLTTIGNLGEGRWIEIPDARVHG